MIGPLAMLAASMAMSSDSPSDSPGKRANLIVRAAERALSMLEEAIELTDLLHIEVQSRLEQWGRGGNANAVRSILREILQSRAPLSDRTKKLLQFTIDRWRDAPDWPDGTPPPVGTVRLDLLRTKAWMVSDIVAMRDDLAWWQATELQMRCLAVEIKIGVFGFDLVKEMLQGLLEKYESVLDSGAAMKRMRDLVWMAEDSSRIDGDTNFLEELRDLHVIARAEAMLWTNEGIISHQENSGFPFPTGPIPEELLSWPLEGYDTIREQGLGNVRMKLIARAWSIERTGELSKEAIQAQRDGKHLVRNTLFQELSRKDLSLDSVQDLHHEDLRESWFEALFRPYKYGVPRRANIGGLELGLTIEHEHPRAFFRNPLGEVLFTVNGSTGPTGLLEFLPSFETAIEVERARRDRVERSLPSLSATYFINPEKK
jgi:hypothetical protein